MKNTFLLLILALPSITFACVSSATEFVVATLLPPALFLLIVYRYFVRKYKESNPSRARIILAVSTSIAVLWAYKVFMMLASATCGI